MDTFQLIAFLLSVFNIASLMVSNVNKNNNNNNINDNEANVNDNNINESNTNAMVNSMVMVGLGGRSYGTRTEAEGEIHWMTICLMNSTIWDCGLRRYGICFRGLGKHYMEPSSSGDYSVPRPFHRLGKNSFIIDVIRDMFVHSPRTHRVLALGGLIIIINSMIKYLIKAAWSLCFVRQELLVHAKGGFPFSSLRLPCHYDNDHVGKMMLMMYVILMMMLMVGLAKMLPNDTNKTEIPQAASLLLAKILPGLGAPNSQAR